MSKLDILKKIIREEVAIAVRLEFKAFVKEELLPLLEESRKPLVEARQIKDRVPRNTATSISQTIGLPAKLKPKEEEIQDPIQRLLNETAKSMSNDEYRTIIGADTSHVPAFGMAGNTRESGIPAPVVGTVEQMLQSKRPVTDISQVEIDVVPDFTGLMSTLKDKGAI